MASSRFRRHPAQASVALAALHSWVSAGAANARSANTATGRPHSAPKDKAAPLRHGYFCDLQQSVFPRPNGGAGSRTPVRTSIRIRVYVRRLRFTISGSRHVAIQLPDELSNFLAPDAKATPDASLSFRYPSAASGGLPLGQVRKDCLTQPEPSQCWQLLFAPVVLPGN